MNLSALKKGLPLVVAFFMVALLAPVGYVDAQPTDRPGGATDNCTVRATISGQEASDLTGGQVTGGITRGQQLPLSGPQAGSNAILCTYGLIVFAAILLFVLLLAVAILFILLAAYYFISSGGDEGKNQKARSYVIYAIVGLVLAGLAFVIPAVARAVLGV